MAGLRLPDQSRLPIGPRRDLAEALHALYVTAGKPSTRQISVWIRADDDLPGTLSHEGVSAVLRGVSSPRWQSVASLALVLIRHQAVDELDPADVMKRIHDLWKRADADADADADAEADAGADAEADAGASSAAFESHSDLSPADVEAITTFASTVGAPAVGASPSSHVERLEQANHDGVSRLWLEDGWLAITLTPAKPGRQLLVDREASRSWLREHFTSRPWGLSVDAGAVLGRRRVIFTDKFPYPGYSTDHHLEMHADGTGFAAVAMATSKPPLNAAERGMNETSRYFHALKIEIWTVQLLDVLAHHAVHTGGGGDFRVRAQLLPGLINIAGPGRPTVPDYNRPVALIEDFEDRGAYYERMVPGSRALTAPEPLDTVVPANIAISARDLVAAAADIAGELIVDFGEPPRMTLLQLDGSVGTEAAGRPIAGSFRGWAQIQGLLGPSEP